MKNLFCVSAMVALVAAATLTGCPPTPVDTIHTQLFATGEVDLEGKQLYFHPSATSYNRTVTTGITNFSVSPTGHELIDFVSADPFVLNLAMGSEVVYFGTLYNALYIGSDGTVSFGSAGTGNDTLADHFSAPQISLLPVDATASGEVSYSVFTDAVVITFDGVDGNSFQSEFFITDTDATTDGDIAVSYPTVNGDAGGVVGLSNGQLVGLDADAIASFLEGFNNSDLGTTNTGT